jgi:FAD/FMN-containing dehydrogenase
MEGDLVDLARLGGGRVELSASALQEFAAGVDGLLIRPGDPAWGQAVSVWNGRVVRTPALVLRPASASDVAAAVDLARRHRVLLSVKGGGHSLAGTGLADSALTLDMSSLREVRVNPATRQAHVESGCLLTDVDRATQRHGLATVLGLVSQTGVAGLTLGGGFGYLTRRFGWTVDNLVEVEIVTADGDIRTANRSQEPDMFWAVRGGGGNVGVVTRFTYALHPVGPTVTGGLVAWTADLAGRALAAYRELTESAPRELTAALFVTPIPPDLAIPADRHGQPMVGIFLCHSGTVGADLDSLSRVGRPIIDLLGERPYVEQQGLFDADLPAGLAYHERSEFLPGLSDGFIEAFGAQALQVPGPIGEAVVLHLGGAVNDRAEDDGAVGNRDAQYVTWCAAAAPDRISAEQLGWVDQTWTAIRAFSTGGNYINFQSRDDATSRIRETYRSNFDRLVQVKQRYDPDNLFRVNRNVSPPTTARV